MEITSATRADFDFIYSELVKAFILDERRDYEDALRLFNEGKYEILLFSLNGEDVGFITVWRLSNSIFFEHFLIYEKHRNNGYGAIALRELKKRFERIVLEAEPPISKIAERRLNFYKRNGFIENEKDYLQPSYRKGGSSVPLVLMSFPEKLFDFESTVSEIYGKVYFSE